MSFIKTLATLAVGFAAAKGYQKFQTGGGMAGMKGAMGQAGQPGGLADTLGGMAERMGIPGATEATRKAMGQMGSAGVQGADAAQTGWGNLMGMLTGATAAGSAAVAGMMGSAAEATGMGEVSEANARLLIRAMIQAAKSDGTIDAEERARIMEHIKDAGADEMAFVMEQFEAPVDPVALAADTDAAMRAQVYAVSLMAITADTDAERNYLDRLATALGLDAATRSGLHAAQGMTV